MASQSGRPSRQGTEAVGELDPVRLRLDNWRTALWAWSGAPVTGVGVGGFGQAIHRPLAGGAVQAHIGEIGKPYTQLGIEVLEVGEGAAFQEARLDVADGPLHLAFGSRPVRRTGACLETAMIRKSSKIVAGHVTTWVCPT